MKRQINKIRRQKQREWQHMVKWTVNKLLENAAKVSEDETDLKLIERYIDDAIYRELKELYERKKKESNQ